VVRAAASMSGGSFQSSGWTWQIWLRLWGNDKKSMFYRRQATGRPKIDWSFCKKQQMAWNKAGTLRLVTRRLVYALKQRVIEWRLQEFTGSAMQQLDATFRTSLRDATYVRPVHLQVMKLVQLDQLKYSGSTESQFSFTF